MGAAASGNGRPLPALPPLTACPPCGPPYKRVVRRSAVLTVIFILYHLVLTLAAERLQPAFQSSSPSASRRRRHRRTIECTIECVIVCDGCIAVDHLDCSVVLLAVLTFQCCRQISNLRLSVIILRRSTWDGFVHRRQCSRLILPQTVMDWRQTFDSGEDVDLSGVVMIVRQG